MHKIRVGVKTANFYRAGRSRESKIEESETLIGLFLPVLLSDDVQKRRGKINEKRKRKMK